MWVSAIVWMPAVTDLTRPAGSSSASAAISETRAAGILAIIGGIVAIVYAYRFKKAEQEVTDRVGKEIKSTEIGEKVINKLFELDEIAYVRFASVYRQFKDINQFMSELKDLLAQKG